MCTTWPTSTSRPGAGAATPHWSALARALTDAFGPDDVRARIAGTGFLVLAYGLEAAGRSAVVRRMEAQLDQPESLSLVGAQAALSFGWVSRPPGSPTSLEEHIARADRDMWEARSAAWNQH